MVWAIVASLMAVSTGVALMTLAAKACAWVVIPSLAVTVIVAVPRKLAAGSIVKVVPVIETATSVSEVVTV